MHKRYKTKIGKAIDEYLNLQNEKSFCANNVYQYLEDKEIKANLATIYRNLEQLVLEKKLSKFKTANSDIYQYRLLERPQIVVANKMDEENAEENLKAFKEKVGEDVKVFPISAIIHEGVDQVLYAVADALETAPKFDMEEVEENTVVYNYEEEEAPFVVHNLGNGQWTITGKKIERLVSMTSLVSDDAIKRLSIKMRNMGIDEALRNAGCQDGDVVSILDFEFEFYD